MIWKTLERPGQSGNKRDEIRRQYDKNFGKDKWRIMWQWGEDLIPYTTSYQIYEDGYYADSFNREQLWKDLIKTAFDIYDHDPSDTESGLDYLIQKGNATHLQDISIRRVVSRRGWRFQGDKLVQIRSHSDYWGQNLSPGKVQFHLPELIVAPHLKGWWDYNSIEDFYQSNKFLQVRED